MNNGIIRRYKLNENNKQLMSKVSDLELLRIKINGINALFQTIMTSEIEIVNDFQMEEFLEINNNVISEYNAIYNDIIMTLFGVSVYKQIKKHNLDIIIIYDTKELVIEKLAG